MGLVTRSSARLSRVEERQDDHENDCVKYRQETKLQLDNLQRKLTISFEEVNHFLMTSEVTRNKLHRENTVKIYIVLITSILSLLGFIAQHWTAYNASTVNDPPAGYHSSHR